MSAGRWPNPGRSDRGRFNGIPQRHGLPAKVGAAVAADVAGTVHSTLAADLQDTYFWQDNAPLPAPPLPLPPMVVPANQAVQRAAVR